MKIAKKIETIWFQAVSNTKWRQMNPYSRQALPNNLWVRIYTDDGLVGLGETFSTCRDQNSLFDPICGNSLCFMRSKLTRIARTR